MRGTEQESRAPAPEKESFPPDHVVSFGLRKPLALSSSKAIRAVFRGKENVMIFEIRRWEELDSEIQSLLSFDNYQWRP